MDDLKSKLFQVTRTASQVTGDFFKTAKMSMTLSGEEDKLRHIYIEIGKKVHEIYMFGGTLGKFFDEKYKEIENCEKRISELKKQIDDVKGTKTCSKCGKSIPATAEFCSKCGNRMEGVSSEAKPVTEDDIMKTLEKIRAEDTVSEKPVNDSDEQRDPNKPLKKCPLCSAENEEGEKYCFSCGRML